MILRNVQNKKLRYVFYSFKALFRKAKVPKHLFSPVWMESKIKQRNKNKLQRTYLSPCPISLSLSLVCLWAPYVSMSRSALLYFSSFFCRALIVCVHFWFFFSNICLIRSNCCLSASPANFRYSLTLAENVVRIFCMFLKIVLERLFTTNPAKSQCW